MSDQLIYIAMTGLNAVQDKMTASGNNLANVGTTAYKAQRPAYQALPFYGQGLPSRADVATLEEQPDFRAGAIQNTGRALDVVVNGPGWIGVQAADGTPAYTRNGALQISGNGVLETSVSQPILGEDGNPITLPPLGQITIGTDGTISGVPQGQSADQPVVFGRISLANPAPATMTRRADGLFQSSGGPTNTGDPVTLQSGALETSNVSAVGVMVDMIKQTRMFQAQTELLHTMSTLGQGASSPLSLQ
jgi:flagellar basal-body rod protein FlgF